MQQQVRHEAKSRATQAAIPVASRVMRVGVPKETAAGERRVALVPETIGRLGEGVEVVVEPGAGVAAAFTDDAYTEAGATLGDPWGADVDRQGRSADAPRRRDAARRSGADRRSCSR